MIKVLFRSVLKDYVPEKTEQVMLGYEHGLTVRTILEQYGLQTGHIGLVLIDQRLSDLDCPIRDGAIVELYPIFGGG
ncbi:MAG: MoaD/ThiS family protein [Bacillota bacterium]